MMKNLKKDEKLYNVLFPLWMLMLFPQVWLIVLPGNFIIDSAVLLLTLLILKVGEKKKRYKNKKPQLVWVEVYFLIKGNLWGSDIRRSAWFRSDSEHLWTSRSCLL